jgi:sporulation protein YlmC with PRC-barrel domain
MNKIKKSIMALAFAFCLVFIGSGAFGQGYPEESSGTMAGATFQAGRLDTFEGSWMVGHWVRSPVYAYIGQISGFVIDNTNGRIALVVLSDVPNLGAQELAIPFSSIIRTGRDSFQFDPGDMVIPATTDMKDPVLSYLTWAPSTSYLYGIPSKIDLAWISHIYQHYGRNPYWTEEGMKSKGTMEFEFFESTELMGARVQTSQGEEVARVNDLVIDSSGGHITFAVLSDVAGRGDYLVAVPYGALSRCGEHVLNLNATRDQLTSAPSFDEHADMSNLAYAADVYRYFGQQPYWTEGEGR